MRQVRKAGDSAILNEEAVRIIRRKAREGTLVVSEAALFYDVGFEAIRRVVRRETWRHVRDVEAVALPAGDEMAAMAQRLMQAQADRDNGQAPPPAEDKGRALADALGVGGKRYD